MSPVEAIEDKSMQHNAHALTFGTCGIYRRSPVSPLVIVTFPTSAVSWRRLVLAMCPRRPLSGQMPWGLWKTFLQKRLCSKYHLRVLEDIQPFKILFYYGLGICPMTLASAELQVFCFFTGCTTLGALHMLLLR